MTKHATLFYNANAGFEDYSPKVLMSALEAKGFSVTHLDTHENNWETGLKKPGDLVVVAGGDGTVAKIGRKLAGSGVPVGILPLGTANNIATSLMISGEPEDIIKDWDMKKRKSFDVGIMDSPWGKKYFLESVGFGLFPMLIREREDDDKDAKKSREEELDDALKHQIKILEEYTAHGCTININGETLSGEYLMVEIMNIPYAGANMCLAPNADPGDGLFDIVLVREEERKKFEKFLTSCRKSNPEFEQLHLIRAKELTVEWNGRHAHADDKARKAEAPLKLDIKLVPKALEFLIN